MRANVQLLGLKSSIKSMRNLAKSLDGKALQDVANEAAEPMLDRAKVLAPKDRGVLAANLVIRRTRKRKTYGEVAVTNNKKAAHAILQELGVSSHAITSTGKDGVTRTVKHPGHKPQPFFRPAFKQKLQTSKQIGAAALRRKIFKEIRRNQLVLK